MYRQPAAGVDPVLFYEGKPFGRLGSFCNAGHIRGNSRVGHRADRQRLARWPALLLPGWFCQFYCGSGFPAANHFNTDCADRGWKAAPTMNNPLL
jgi:hypothetical protein